MNLPRRIIFKDPSSLEQAAFTLVEMLLVVSILAIVSLALFHTLLDGLKIWERTKRYVVEEDISIFFDKVSQDLRNSYWYSKIPFTGKYNYVRIPTYVKILSEQSERLHQGMGAVEYFFDSHKKKLLLKQASYGQALRGDFSRERVLLDKVDEVRFSYYFSRPDGGIVSPDEIDNVVPRSVEIEVSFSDGQRKRTLKKIVNLLQGS